MKEKWGKKYPYAIRNREDANSFFQFSGNIRRIMYTANIIEGLNRQYRKVTKTKSVFPGDTSLEKMLHPASGNVIKKCNPSFVPKFSLNPSVMAMTASFSIGGFPQTSLVLSIFLQTCF